LGRKGWLNQLSSKLVELEVFDQDNVVCKYKRKRKKREKEKERKSKNRISCQDQGVS